MNISIKKKAPYSYFFLINHKISDFMFSTKNSINSELQPQIDRFTNAIQLFQHRN